VEIVIGLGGNLGDVPHSFRVARSGLAQLGDVVGCSRLFWTRPIGPSQPPYANAALVLATCLPPGRLLDRCRELETAAGRDREREARWGPRPLDLDLLIARGLVHRGPWLELPHPRFAERRFALAPAAEVAGGWLHPLLGRTVSDLAAAAAAREPTAVRRDGSW